jgi:asparagine synthase (glutamine-hydrolysing)
MCGIAGVIGFDDKVAPSEAMLTRMCDAMTHRGPDDFGCFVHEGAGIGMRRLSIIDLAGGHQPIFNEDRSVAIVFNGEIYNYRELRQELAGQGHRFVTSSDTEVIVHLYEQVGLDFAERLNGMFAIALLDMRQRRLVLARDHIGIKPLFYSLDAARLVFGSEIKVLLASGLIRRELDVDALGQFMAWEYIPGAATLLRYVRKLEPAHLMTVELDSGRSQVRRFWDIPIGAAGGGARDDGSDDGEQDEPWGAEHWADVVDRKIAEAVRRQLVADVPLGAFLSGGVDSSLVVAHMSDHDSEKTRTFSIGFDDPSYNELAWASKAADHLGVDHRYEIIQPHVADLFDHLMHFMDDPIGDFSIFPTFLVSRHARRDVTVALSGDGGDELFGGYETFQAQLKAEQWSRLPGPLRAAGAGLIRRLRPTEAKKGLINKAKRFIEGLDEPAVLGHARWRVFAGAVMRPLLFTDAALRQMDTPVEGHIAALAARAGDLDAVDRACYVDTRSYLVDNCLVKSDRMSMACSLELRVPLLDKELVELAFGVPSRLKTTSKQTKVLLKRIACRYVPRECIYRPKEGFSIPIKQWLKTDFRPLMESLLDEGNLAAEGLFDVAQVRRLKAEHLAGRANHSHVLWSMMVFADWRRRWRV